MPTYRSSNPLQLSTFIEAFASKPTESVVTVKAQSYDYSSQTFITRLYKGQPFNVIKRIMDVHSYSTDDNNLVGSFDSIIANNGDGCGDILSISFDEYMLFIDNNDDDNDDIPFDCDQN